MMKPDDLAEFMADLHKEITMARLPYPDRDILPADVAGLLGQFPRQAITEMFAHAASLTEPFLLMAQAQFTSIELTARQRELIILTVAGLIDCEYEYVQHVPVSEAVGIDATVRERLRNGDLDAVVDRAEHALVTFVTAVVQAPRVSDDIFDGARAHLSARQIVETLQLVTFYWGIGRICTVLDLEIDRPEGLEAVTGVSRLSR
jgi:alkylhydroperoxidase family enzyme